MADELSYAPPVPWHRQRRVVRMVLALSIVAAVALGTFSFRSGWERYQTRRATELRRQKDMTAWEQANRYTAPATDVVWEEDPAAAAVLLKDAKTFMHNGVGVLRKIPIEQANLLTRVHIGPEPHHATLFLHERTNRATLAAPAERQPLVVQLESTRAGYSRPYNLWQFRTVGVLPTPTGHLGVRERTITLNVPEALNDPTQRTRFYAGQPDPNDPSHFTIRYAVNDVPGTIDGWLHYGSVVELKVRDGPATQPVK